MFERAHSVLAEVVVSNSETPFVKMPALHQFKTAQALDGSTGHATRAGHTEAQPEPWHYDFSAGGYGFPQPKTFEDKYEECEHLKGRLAAAFRIFGQKGFDEGVAGHITLRVRFGLIPETSKSIRLIDSRIP